MKKIYKDEELPKFDFIIDKNNPDSLKRVSLVNDPAIEVEGMYFSKDQIYEEQFFFDEEEQIVAGPVMIPDIYMKRKDHNGNFYLGRFREEVIRDMYEIFAKNMRNRPQGVINDNHTNKMVDAYPKGWWIIEDSYKDKSSFYGYNLPKGTFFMECKVEDKKYWDEEVKGNKKFSYSIETICGIKPSTFSNENEWFEVLNEVGWLDMDEEFIKFLNKIDTK